LQNLPPSSIFVLNHHPPESLSAASPVAVTPAEQPTRPRRTLSFPQDESVVYGGRGRSFFSGPVGATLSVTNRGHKWKQKRQKEVAFRRCLPPVCMRLPVASGRMAVLEAIFALSRSSWTSKDAPRLRRQAVVSFKPSRTARKWCRNPLKSPNSGSGAVRRRTAGDMGLLGLFDNSLQGDRRVVPFRRSRSRRSCPILGLDQGNGRIAHAPRAGAAKPVVGLPTRSPKMAPQGIGNIESAPGNSMRLDPREASDADGSAGAHSPHGGARRTNRSARQAPASGPEMAPQPVEKAGLAPRN
jgi:hypothetical protein